MGVQKVHIKMRNDQSRFHLWLLLRLLLTSVIRRSYRTSAGHLKTNAYHDFSEPRQTYSVFPPAVATTLLALQQVWAYCRLRPVATLLTWFFRLPFLESLRCPMGSVSSSPHPTTIIITNIIVKTSPQLALSALGRRHVWYCPTSLHGCPSHMFKLINKQQTFHPSLEGGM